MTRVAPRRKASLISIALLISGASAWSVGAPAHYPSSALGDPAVTEHAASAGPSTDAASSEENLVKALGEEGALVNSYGEALFSISITSIEVVDGCPSRAHGLAFTAGAFVVLDVTAHLRPEILDFSSEPDSAVYFPLLPETFALFDPDGDEVAGPATHAAWECFDDDELLPSFIFPGESAQGRVVLEAPVRSGTVAYMPAEAPGWQWHF